jgi:hypothetical protein
MIVIDALLLRTSLNLWFAPAPWGWSLPSKIKAIILLFFILGVLIVSIIAIVKKENKVTRKVVFVLLVSLLSLPVAIFVISYTPREALPEVALEQLGITPNSLSLMSPCERVAVFAEAGYHYLGIQQLIVLLPEWVHQSLENIPRDVLANCIKDEIMKQLTFVEGDSYQHEVAKKKIYALYYEAWRLNILDAPPILDAGNLLVCSKKIDTLGDLRFLFYIGQHGELPPYNYLSEEGKSRLYADVCEE